MTRETIKSPKDKRWYYFRWECDLHIHSGCNLSSEEMHGCVRPDRKGIPRLMYEPALCKVNACPILKGKIPMNEDQKRILK